MHAGVLLSLLQWKGWLVRLHAAEVECVAVGVVRLHAAEMECVAESVAVGVAVGAVEGAQVARRVGALRQKGCCTHL